MHFAIAGMLNISICQHKLTVLWPILPWADGELLALLSHGREDLQKDKVF